VARWHRRSGKDDVFLNHVACAAHERVGNYWYMLPEYSQARKSMWDAVNPHTGKKRVDAAFPKELRKTTRDQEMMIQFHNGSTFQLVGSDNFNSLVGSPPVGLVFSEYALSNPTAWGYLRPILLENGGWAGFNATPRGNNHFKALCKQAETSESWFYDVKTADQTGVFTKEQLDAELKELQTEHGDEYGMSLWQQEYFCSFDAAIMGAIWGDCVAKAEAAGRICDVPIEPGFPVSTAWDLGRTDDTAIWFFQMIAGRIHVVDFYAANGKEIPEYAQVLRDWKEKYGIEYATHWLPHDAKPRRLGMGGKSILQQFHEEQVGRFSLVPQLDRQEGIYAARKTFPLCRFDKTRCEDGLECLRQYHREWDEENQKFSDSPAHDWSSHAADAWRYLSLVWKHPKSKEPGVPLNAQLMNSSIRKQTFGHLRDKHFAKMKAARQGVFH
jgi:phage terminase large subunit